jgi:hypothetical protein
VSEKPTKARYYWARIGTGNYEPVAVRGKRGERMAWTIGCADPFAVDTPDTAIELNEDEYEQLTVPLTPEQEERALRRERNARAQFEHHGYAGFGREAQP